MYLRLSVSHRPSSRASDSCRSTGRECSPQCRTRVWPRACRGPLAERSSPRLPEIRSEISERSTAKVSTPVCVDHREKERGEGGARVGLYKILPLPKFYDMYCKKGWSWGHIVLRNSVGDVGGKWDAQTKGVFANNNIDSRIKASK